MAKIYYLVVFLLAFGLIFSQASAKGGFITPEGEKLALIIGISIYQDPAIRNLSFSDNDALAFKKVLIEKGGVPPGNIKLLLNEEATFDDIRRGVLRWLGKQAGEGATAIIYFSGHGGYGNDWDGDEEDGLDEYLLPYDTFLGDESTGIVDDIFGYWLRQLEADNTVVILDSCYSGDADRGVSFSGIAKSPRESIGKGFLDDLSVSKRGKERDRAVIIMTSGDSNQKVAEEKKLKHGIFTYYLLEGLSGKADKDRDRMISAQEAFIFASDRVKEYIKSQTPVMKDEAKRAIYLTSF